VADPEVAGAEMAHRLRPAFIPTPEAGCCHRSYEAYTVQPDLVVSKGSHRVRTSYRVERCHR
jgi:hypothetical protein